jgi:hypothetical protein
MRYYRVALALVFSVFTSSCSSLVGGVPGVDDAMIISKVQSCNDGPKAANDYMQVGFSNIYAACEAFFVNATRFQQNALATSSTLDAALIGATSIINVTNASAAAVKAITITTAGVTLGKAVLSDYVTIYTFGTHLYKVRQLVQSDMDNFVGQVKAPADTCIAYAAVQTLATKCTIANMQALLDAQVAIPSQTVPAAPASPPSPLSSAKRSPASLMTTFAPLPATSVPRVSSTVIAR